MTCVIGIETKDRAYLAVDSFRDHGGITCNVGEGKMVRKERFILASTGSSRQEYLLRYELVEDFEILPLSSDTTEEDWLRSLVTSIRSCNIHHGFIWKDHEREYGTEILVASQFGLHLITSTYGVTKPSDKYWAIGSGEQVALGAMYGILKASDGDISVGITPELVHEILIASLKAAAKYIKTVGPPYHVNYIEKTQ